MKTILAEAEQLFYESSYQEAFAIFEKIAQNLDCQKSIRAEAYNMMGVIITGPAPYLSKNEDESGLEYFKIALELDSRHVGAALNILEGYQTSPTGHGDRESVEFACRLLESHHWETLPEYDRKIVLKNRKKLRG